MTVQTTVTYIARPSDSRCKWWSAILKPEHIDPKYLMIKADLTYLRARQDLELPEGTFIIDSEERHHRKIRGYDVALGYVIDGAVHWIYPTLDRKLFIKAHNGQDLMIGSGDVAGCIRMAIWINRHNFKSIAFHALRELKEYEDL